MNLDDTIAELSNERAARELIRGMFRRIANLGLVGAHNLGVLRGELPNESEQSQSVSELADEHVRDYVDPLVDFAERWVALEGIAPTEPRGGLGGLQFTEEEPEFTLESARKGDRIRVFSTTSETSEEGEVFVHDGGDDRLPWYRESNKWPGPFTEGTYLHTHSIKSYELIERGSVE